MGIGQQARKFQEQHRRQADEPERQRQHAADPTLAEAALVGARFQLGAQRLPYLAHVEESPDRALKSGHPNRLS